MSHKSSQSGSAPDTVTIAVLGVSGTERVKGAYGADFSGSPVINNDHWLYWGEALLNNDDLYANANVRLIEQTEFVDDETFEALSGANEEYAKRATRLKLESADKLMYICKVNCQHIISLLIISLAL
ncbi:unnamed protein product [Anisakis simplex]|uniref:Rho GTPase-activating protein 190 (inferred by orthology to a D. melanogaster protein) n=1 Tax=Anisakis simplex TaxID=6269 RepID=A0A0M3KJI7_ANISI|nr:unnamed protein product [Anisakis simplex]